jgi:hydrogenase expression/formation protein HypC
VQSLLASGAAVCAGSAADTPPRTVETSLLERAPRPGEWLLVHVDVAVRALEPAEAQQIGDALRAVAAAAAGEPFEHLLADLIEREPELPPHLRAQAAGGAGGG